MAAEAEAVAGNPSIGRGRVRAALWTVLWLVVLLVLAVGGFISRYQPLDEGSLSGVTAQYQSLNTYATPDTAYLLEHEEGAEFLAAFSIRNNGPVGVTVRQVAEIREPLDFVVFPVEVVVHPEKDSPGDQVPYDQYASFQPFALAAGEERQVGVRYRFGRCHLERGGATWTDSVSTKFSVLGVSRSVEFQLPYVLVVEGRGGGECS